MLYLNIMSKVIVGMSGGVDSSFAVYLLKKHGYEVEGVSFLLWDAGRQRSTRACCSYHAMEDAFRSADYLDIPHTVIDARSDFAEKVIRPFVDAYLKGLTPNPCILCNRFIKFPLLLKEAERRRAEYVATGHYARAEQNDSTVRGHQSLAETNDRFFLKKGIDSKKDQSYVLYNLRMNELRKLLLPLGYFNKVEVRKMAKELSLPAAGRLESQEVCFIEDKKYFLFIEELSNLMSKPGPIVHLSGKVLGKHKGVHWYTTGQRKGLGISSPEPLYVINIDAVNNIIYVGPREAALKKEFLVGDLNWINPAIPLISPLARGDKERVKLRASVKVRSTMKDKPATIFLIPSAREDREFIHVVFDEPQWAPAPGQSAVFYDGDIVLGGGIIRNEIH